MEYGAKRLRIEGGIGQNMVMPLLLYWPALECIVQYRVSSLRAQKITFFGGIDSLFGCTKNQEGYVKIEYWKNSAPWAGLTQDWK